MVVGEPEHSWGFRLSPVRGGGDAPVRTFENKLTLSPPHLWEMRL